MLWDTVLVSPGYHPLAVVRPFEKSATSFTQRIGRPGREVLQDYASVDLLGAFIVEVTTSSLPACVVPVTDLVHKCIKVVRSDSLNSYVIKLPNNFEHH